jgi:hypothetical protein
MMRRRGTPQRLVRYRSAQVEVDIVIPGKPYAAMKLQAIADDLCALAATMALGDAHGDRGVGRASLN